MVCQSKKEWLYVELLAFWILFIIYSDYRICLLYSKINTQCFHLKTQSEPVVMGATIQHFFVLV